MIKISIKILGFNFSNSILDNSKSDKKIESIAKEIHIWNRVRFSLRGKNVINNQTLLSKLWYIDPNIPKKNIQFPLEQEENTTPQTPGSTLHLDE